jgi:hypothetical protein
MASVGTAKDRTLTRSAVRRPTRSPSMPPVAPPIIMPSGAIASTAVNGARGSCHSRINAGITLPSSWLSMPSSTIASAVPATSSFWYPLQRPSSMTDATSTLFMVLANFTSRITVFHKDSGLGGEPLYCFGDAERSATKTRKHETNGTVRYFVLSCFRGQSRS